MYICARFHEHIAPANPGVSHSVLYVDRNVRRLYKDEAATAALVFDSQSSRLERLVGNNDPHALKQFQSTILETPFRDGYGQLRHITSL
jgi:hypothetical protein